jgi:hypothetical protein
LQEYDHGNEKRLDDRQVDAKFGCYENPNRGIDAEGRRVMLRRPAMATVLRIVWSLGRDVPFLLAGQGYTILYAESTLNRIIFLFLVIYCVSLE